MIQHSMIIDQFFDHPYAVRACLVESEMRDEVASDGVVYPGIVRLAPFIEAEIKAKINYLFQGRLKGDPLMFARYSMKGMKPPHWAHSDFEMAQFVGLIYMNDLPREVPGTFLVRHNQIGLETHPETDEQVEILRRDSNNKSRWDKVFHCPAIFNRMFIVNGHRLHAAGPSFGHTKQDARLVCTVFFALT